VAGIKGYSTNANNNTASPPNGAPIGTTKVSQVDDIIRQVMADVRSYYDAPQWRDLGHTVTYASTTSFTISGNVASSYVVGQRIRITDSSTLYGTIASSSYSAPNTTVTVTMDSGSISASITAVSLGVDPTNDPIPADAITGAFGIGQMPSAVTGYLVPSGAIMSFAGSSAPTGWLLCYGQAVSRSTYSALFSAIGTTHGTGDGSTTFNLPDLRGRAVAGVDNMGGSAASRITSGNSGITGTTLGAVGGDERMHQHTHTLTDPGHTHNIASNIVVGATNGIGNVGNASATAFSTVAATTGITINNSGSGGSQNVQPTIMLNYIIKT
jgi:microcystin-dependent protein